MTRPTKRLQEISALQKSMESRALTEWGDWIQQLRDWEWFVTLTLKEEYLVSHQTSLRVTGLWQLKKRFVSWWEHCNGQLFFRDRGSYVRVLELQSGRRAYHVHALVSGVDCDIDNARTWAWEHIGFNKTVQYVPTMGAAHYVAKYLVKEFQDIEFSEDIVQELGKKEGERQWEEYLTEGQGVGRIYVDG